ncbi:Serine/threonine-protein kinase ULK4 [Fasciola gigantica]|uniref:Serine/threonine-protein kinase ULK4 n=1 Tax=Fasciola gigantica TaxID=46835 RepID=A0A504Z3J2_FASGI|nr:Serine/threonine-protein kinase ULK4 [Fasciola gigantica]
MSTKRQLVTFVFFHTLFNIGEIFPEASVHISLKIIAVQLNLHTRTPPRIQTLEIKRFIHGEFFPTYYNFKYVFCFFIVCLQVLVVFRSHGNDSVETSSSRTVTKISGSRVSTIQRPARTHLLAYLIWLSATATAAISRTPLNNLRDEHRQLIGVTAYPELFGECVRQLKSSSSIPIELRIGLCQLCSILMHRIATVAFCYISNKAGNQSQQVVWKPIASNMPTCLASLVDILREPVARTGHRLRQIALAALGETLTCAVCLLTISVQEAEITGVREGLLIEVQSSQWQTVVHHLLRCLTPALTGSTQVPPSPGVDTPSPLDNLDVTGSEIRTSGGATSQPHTNGNGTSTDSSTSANTTTTTVRVTDAHVRLSAARALDAFLTAILGCRLHDLSVSGSLLVSATACLQAVTTTDVVRHLWTNGVIEVGSARQTTGLLQRNQLNQEISLACASSLAAIIRINPSLFTTGLIDRIGLNSFVNVIEPPAGGPVCQQTSLVVRILSMACSGLLIPLSSRSSGSSVTSRVKRSSVANVSMSSHSRQLVTNAGGAGTPAACRRILTDQRFMVAVLRHLKSPHAMLRAKSYLLCSAILATCPRDSFPLAFDANLPAVLERDLKTTRGVQHRYLDAQSTANMVTSTTDVTGSPCMMYLAACSLHFTDLLVLHLIPLICQQLLIALGCLSPPSGGSTRQTNPRAAGNNLASRRPSRPHSMIGSTRAASLSQASSTSALNSVSLGCNLTTARAWLPSITCLTGLLNACPTVRSRLLQPDSQALSGSREHLDSSVSDFCLLAVLGRLLDLWASVDPISSSSIAGLHQPGTTENQLLCVTLTIIEDLSQHSELVESRRRDFICLILPGLARLAVAPGARPETRAICVKIVTNLADILLGESGYGASSTHSLNELHRSESVRVKKTYLDNTGRDTQANPYNDRRLSADVELLLKELEQPTDDWSQERTQSYSELFAPPKSSPVDVMTQSQYSPSGADKLGSRTRFYGATGSARTKRMERRSGAKTIRAAVQPPTPDVLVSLFEMVNKLMIPYVDQLIQCSEVTAPTAFIRLLNLLLGSAANLQPHRSPTNPNHTSNQTPTARGDCPDADTSVLDDLTATRWTAVDHRARALVLNMAAHGLDVAIVRLLASQLLNPSELDPNWSGKSQGSVASALCLALFHMVPLLLHWPRESRPSHWIIELRLLELIAIACLELGDLMFPPITDVADPNETHRTSSQTRNQSPKKHPFEFPKPASCHENTHHPNLPRNLSRSRLPSSPLGRRLPPDGVHAPVQHLYIPLLAGLEAMNTLLNHVADVVGIALAARSANASDSETAAMAAEEILVASRPPPSLAGLLARLVGLWRPKCVDGSSTDTPERMNSYSADRVIEEEICFQLCEAAITGLTNFASLYGGEYSRSALTPSAAASLSLGLLRLAEEEQKLQHDRCPTSSGPASFVKVSNPSGKTSWTESPGLKQSAQSRRRLRLLLRIIKRLVFSDPFCRSQLAAEATEDGGTSNLYTTLLFLGEQTQRNADASTTKLVREIIDFVKPAQRFARDRSAASADARATSAHVRKQSDTRIGPTKVA